MCRGQGYDGAAVMSGIYSGVQKRIMEKEENGIYVHCNAHNLNLVINDAASGVPENVHFFLIVERIYTFFGNSIVRWKLLTDLIEKRQENRKLKRLYPTRWSSRHQSRISIRFKYKNILLSKIILTAKNSNERDEAMSLKKEMETFEFVLLVVLHSKILLSTDAISKQLQNKNCDLSKASSGLKNALTELQNFRTQFEEAKEIAKDLCSEWGVSTLFTQKRRKKTKRHFDELCED